MQACTLETKPINVMYDTRPVTQWEHTGKYGQTREVWWYQTLQVADPLRTDAFRIELATSFVETFNTPGLGPYGPGIEDASAIELVVDSNSLLVRPTNDWHPASFDAQGDPPSTPWSGTHLWPDRCTYTTPEPGPVTLRAMMRHCARATPVDSKMLNDLGAWEGVAVHLPAGLTLSLTDYLQRLSNERGLQWLYTCGLTQFPSWVPASSPANQLLDTCGLHVFLPEESRATGRLLVRRSEQRHGETRCPSVR